MDGLTGWGSGITEAPKATTGRLGELSRLGK